jgi:hypothetical protein
MDRNKQKGKRLVIKHKALKWFKTNSAPLKGSPWRLVSRYNISPIIMGWTPSKGLVMAKK